MPIRDQRPVEPVPIPVPVTTTEPYGAGLVRDDGSSTSGLAGGLLRNTDRNLGVTTPVSGAPTGLPGSPLNTLYGVDSESYLTDEQKKLARQIQGKFDASLNSRDRALQRYGAPQLSSYVEDEALARAMSLARGLNFPEQKNETPVNASGLVRNSGAPARTNTPRYTPPVPGAPTNTGAQNAASWQRIMSGLASIVPLLFGKNAYGEFLNKGLFGSIKEALFGPEVASTISDAQLQQIIESGAAPNAGGITYNPITGQPMAIDQGFTPGGLGDPYGSGSGWGGVESSVTADAYGPGSNWGGVEGAAPDPYWADWSGSADYGNWFPTGNEWDFSSLAGP